MKKLFLLLGMTLMVSTVAFADVDCTNLIPCKFSRKATVCETSDCPAFLVTVTQDAKTLNVAGAVYGQPACGGDVVIPIEGAVELGKARTYIIFVPLDADTCPPALPYSFQYGLAECPGVTTDCVDTACFGTEPNCDAGNEELPAINIRDLK